MKNKHLGWALLLLTILFQVFNLSAQKPLKIKLENPGSAFRKDVLIKIRLADLVQRQPGFNAQRAEVVYGKTVLPFQWNDADGNGQPEELAVLVDVPGNAKKVVLIRPSKSTIEPVFEKRTQAELSHKTGGHWEDRKYLGGTFQNVQALRVPAAHTDHSFFIRYEGPGWESDKVGYRFYLDWRNATDIFGKTGPGMVLQNVGQDGFDSYHEYSSWGMDVLKVGESLGIGSLGYWNQGKAQRVDVTDSLYCEVALNGPIESMIRTVYSGWKAGNSKTDVVSELSIQAGSHLTRHVAQLSQPLENLCTGLVKLPETEMFWNAPSAGPWEYMATFGKQSLNNDNLGMAIFYKKEDLLEKTADAQSHVLVLKPKNKQVEYFFMAAWEKEPDGPKDRAAFQRYLDSIRDRLNKPVTMTLY